MFIKKTHSKGKTYVQIVQSYGDRKGKPKQIGERLWGSELEIEGKKLAPAQVIEAYKLLWQVEHSFRCLKSTIKLRPIFHWTQKRIEGHIMLCFLSFYILRIIQRKLHYAKLDITPQKALEKLSEIRAVEIKTDSKIYVARTEITGVNTKILRALSCKIPSAIIQEINL